MSGPRAVADLVREHYARYLDPDDAVELGNLLESIGVALTVARLLRASVDGRTRSLVITKLEEAEHWAANAFRATAELQRVSRREPMPMLPNDHHPGPGCSCRECLRRFPDADREPPESDP
jgi:hypothetical protein